MTTLADALAQVEIDKKLDHLLEETETAVDTMKNLNKQTRKENKKTRQDIKNLNRNPDHERTV